MLRGVHAERCAKRIVQLTNAGVFDAIYASRFVNTPNSSFVRFMGWHECFDPEDIALVAGLKTDMIFDKHSFSCFDSDISLAETIATSCLPNSPRVYICGFDTEACVLRTAFDCFEQGIRPLVLADYCSSSQGTEYHEAGLTCMRSAIGAVQVLYGTVECADDLAKLTKHA